MSISVLILYTGMGTLANGVVIYILGYQIPRAVFVSGLSEHVALIGPESSNTQEYKYLSFILHTDVYL